MAQTSKRDITRVNMNLPTEMVNKVKEYADSLGLPVTQAYTVLISMALEQKDMIKHIPSMLSAVNNIVALKSSDMPKLANNNELKS